MHDVEHQQVLRADERLARGVELQVHERRLPKRSPVLLCDTQARHSVRLIPGPVLNVLLHCVAERHVLLVHHLAIQAEHLGTLESDDVPAHALAVGLEAACPDGERGHAGVGNQFIMLAVERHAVHLGLLKADLQQRTSPRAAHS
jgi:hypothetical protein